ncbi:MAG: DUF3786 domain-containing protein [Spirochaetes bacterium]|nr:DUF3786 domain-containing protein [Spirochaetota bacterium]
MASKDNITDSIYYAPGIKLPKQDNYETAYNEAAGELLKRDLKDIALKSGAQLIQQDASSILALTFLYNDIYIEYPQIRLYYKNKDTEPGLWYKILILHYLIQAKGSPASGEQITFKQITGGLAYYPAFHRRTIKPLIKSFENDFNKYIIAAERIGGVKSDISKYSVFFRVFPRVSVLLNLWEGDEELPCDGNIVFDSSITDYLTTEDITVLCNIITLTIIKEGAGE